MRTDLFFHPYDVVPAVEFISALFEVGDKVVAHMAVEIDAVRIHIGIGRGGIGDAGVECDDALCAKIGLKGFVELASRAGVTGLLSDVDGCLDILVIGGAGMEGAGVDVAYDLSSPLCDEVGIGFKGGLDPASEFFFAGDFVFKGDGGLCDVGGIDRKQRCCVIGGRGADGDGRGCHRKPF